MQGTPSQMRCSGLQAFRGVVLGIILGSLHRPPRTHIACLPLVSLLLLGETHIQGILSFIVDRVCFPGRDVTGLQECKIKIHES